MITPSPFLRVLEIEYLEITLLKIHSCQPSPLDEATIYTTSGPEEVF